MINSDKANFARLLTTLAELHNKKISEQLLSIYWHSLQKYEFNDIKRSLNRLLIDPDVGQFMPKPADIVRYIEGDTQTQALLAWGKVMQAIRQIGVWDSVEFDDRKIHAVIVDMGGWIRLCSKTTQELNYIFNEFQKRYLAYKFIDLPTYPIKLIGKIEQANNQVENCLNISNNFGFQRINVLLPNIDTLLERN